MEIENIYEELEILSMRLFDVVDNDPISVSLYGDEIYELFNYMQYLIKEAGYDTGI